MPKLTYTIDGNEKIVEVTESCSIGKADGNTIVLADEPAASRRHCQIMKLSKSFEISDLGSTNGTKVNGKTVKRHSLRHGDRIEIGETALRWAEREEDGKSAAAEAGGCYLVLAGGARDGERVKIGSRVTFGRKPSNDISFDSSAVSGFHCEISKEGGAYVLRDLGSTNGTMVDGEPITEIALQHGQRLRVGDQRIVFVDPSVSDFEEAMAAVDDLGSEWGMLRAEMDMSRAQSARRSQVVGFVALAVVVGIGGWVLSNPDMFGEQVAGLEVDPDNLLKDNDFSFEDLASGWDVKAGSPAQAGFEEGEGKQGTSFYAVDRKGPAGAPAVAEYTGKEFTVRPGQAYEFGGWMKATGGGQAAMRVLWIGAGEGVATRHSSTPLVSAGSWTESKAVAMPPPNTSAARLELINVGGGRAYFDDIWAKRSDGGPTSADDGPIKVQANPDGSFGIWRESDALIEDLAVVGGLFGDGAGTGARPARAGTASVSSVSKSDGGVTISGSVLDPYSGESGDFSVAVTLAGGRNVNIKATLPKGAGLLGIVAPDFVKEGVGVWTASGSFRETQTRYVTNVARISVGSLKRYESSASGFSLAILSDDGGTALGFGGDGALELSIDTDTKALDDKRDALRVKAETAKAQAQMGQAMKLYEAYAAEFPEGDRRRVAALTEAEALQAAGGERDDILRDNIVGAVAYGDLEALRALEKEAQNLIDSYGSPVANAALTTIQEAIATRRKTESAKHATPLLGKAADYRKGGMKSMAAAIYRDIVLRFTGTDAATKAQAELASLGQ